MSRLIIDYLGLLTSLPLRILFRGVTVSAINDALMVGCQFVLTGYFQKQLTGGQVPICYRPRLFDSV